MNRPRACGALIHGNTILMVQHREPTRSYWTLPGGGVVAGETPAVATVNYARGGAKPSPVELVKHKSEGRVREKDRAWPISVKKVAQIRIFARVGSKWVLFGVFRFASVRGENFGIGSSVGMLIEAAPTVRVGHSQSRLRRTIGVTERT